MENRIKNVVKAESIGFCSGVRGAVGSLEKAVQSQEGPVYTLGPIIHNPQVIRRFEEWGVLTVHTPEEIPEGSTVVIRAHGIPPAVREKMTERGLRMIEGTCPKVIASQKKVRKYDSLGYQIVIVGDAKHGEIVGLAGYAGHPHIVSTPEDAEALVLSGKAMVVSQTTIKQDEYDKVCDVLRRNNPALKVVNSICSATSDRQQALKILCGKVEACLIIGGKNSANTQRLYWTARETGIPVWHIEDLSELPSAIRSFETVGISAGASTPDSLIREAEEALLAR